MDLRNKRNFGQQVRRLYIGNMKYNAQFMSALPAIFPRVRFLEFKGGRDRCGSQNGEIDSQVFKVVAKNWKGFEGIKNLLATRM